MKYAVAAANGKAGQKIVKELKDRGLDVTAIVRGENRTVSDQALIKDLFDLNKEDVENFDVIIDAFGAWTPETLPLHTKSSQHLADLVSGTDQRLLIVGGAGSLFVNPEHTKTVSDGADFPEEFKPLAAAQAKELEELRKRDDVNWTFLSPAADFRPDGERTGKYTLGGEELMVNENGESVISYADYAVAMVDEAVSGKHIKERISVVSE